MASLDLSDIVSTDIELFIESLLPIRASKDFAFPDKILKAVLSQVIEDENIVFEKNEKNICSAIFREIKSSGKISGKRIMETAKTVDFEWELYDRCIWLCETHNILDTNFRYISKPSEPSIDYKESLFVLKANEIKAILKANGHLTTGTRDELLNRLWQFLPIKDTEKALNKQYQESFVIYKTKYLTLKYQALAHFFLQRAYFVRQILKQAGIKDNPFMNKFVPEVMQGGGIGDRKLAKLVDGTGFDGIIMANTICKFLPIFPYDLVSINFRYQR